MIVRRVGAVAPLVMCVLLCLSVVTPAAAVENQLQEMIRSANLRGTKVSAMVVDLDRGHVLAAINADEPMIPASNMKLLTTATALDVLGTDFVFRTKLAKLTPEDGGRPSLVVLGDGDPAFGDPVLLGRHDPPLVVEDLLAQWVNAVVATGQTHFESLLLDDRALDREFHHASWPEEQLINRWCAQVAGVNFHQNVIDVQATPNSRSGASPRVEIFPPAPFLQTRNRARTGDSDAFWISRSPGTNNYTFHGTVQARPYTAVQVTVHDPPMFFGQVLQAQLKAKGITVDRVERVADDVIMGPTEPLHVVQTSLPLVLIRVNQNSQNMFAEALLKRMGRAMTGEPGSWDNGAAAMRFALRQRLGTSGARVTIADGSGMSRDNRVTARLLVDLLHSMHNDDDKTKAELFRVSLARAGDTGTLRRRMRDLDAEVYAKTGYIRGVSGLSGYIHLPEEHGDGRTIAFSFLFNGFAPPLHNHHMRTLQDEMIEAIKQRVKSQSQLGG
ncbi:D-alanyl-D-alanine carboxypeptidase/D-alanyl-D-alanine-endopeptidase [Phycisphaerales bacterium AB-hyl4]|uniref:D-alanyl-D-alanine carboxypeptidase/D-alanyl-D-alanine-endopeptidase n=1 Tax=Natronomicrosphaera hydrolytica TaxID=3242702 RepID=A0ABV4UA07_9BACT